MLLSGILELRRTATVNGLTTGVTYSFRVAARNASGLAPWSAIVTARVR